MPMHLLPLRQASPAGKLTVVVHSCRESGLLICNLNLKFFISGVGSTAVSAAGIKMRRATPPSVYLKKNDEGKVEFVWSR